MSIAYIIIILIFYIIIVIVILFQPDSYPIMDRHPVHHNIIIGAGFSGLKL